MKTRIVAALLAGACAMLPAAASAAPDYGFANFRYQSISGLTLVAGQTYTIAGFFPGLSTGANDPWVYGGPTHLTGFTVDPAITIGPNAARYTYDSGSLVDPGQRFSDYQIYAVNFLTSAVPEPASWAMMIAGFGVVGGAMRRSRAKPAFSAA